MLRPVKALFSGRILKNQTLKTRKAETFPPYARRMSALFRLFPPMGHKNGYLMNRTIRRYAGGFQVIHQLGHFGLHGAAAQAILNRFEYKLVAAGHALTQ